MDFPTDVAEFDNDPRISFTRLDNSFLLETSGGRESLFNSIATTCLRLHSRPLNAPPRKLRPLSL
ncbi:Nuclear mRNA splicing factor-associated protein [Penicillium desertorum]|uniref:Nuclear mRNA splicing factor-associated protein n=1 Tax=Penicillium desertorum TaxID=1303715 RepID=A0A9W9WX92_9EURO|nr:Nuclear mRNA splicing factor-associated protein [Penicillium desertorum]